MADIIEFYKTPYTVKFINLLRQYWQNTKTFSCILDPKKNPLIFYLDGCSARYVSRGGCVTLATDGDTVFVPAGAEYTVELFDFNDERAGTVGINFFIFDESGKSVSLDTNISVVSSPEIAEYVKKIEMLNFAFDAVPARYNACLYEIITLFGEELAGGKMEIMVELIRPGAEYLVRHFNENVSISFLASMCNISEVYFRRLFLLVFSSSPVRYREKMRLERARHYLKYSESSVSEIAEQLGYTDSSYFVKQFKKETGQTPLDYRKNKR